ncbi:glycosyltransferase family 39 protein [Natrononativus amylolyticus]|uniref:glycosyltransferase family 39 protein n=1 Tax=Natrononativus amylolyticus TaxID=2963434 RepID=UPI0020CE06B2|nr:glycosyltransferase family 39 protein [Natrononativus amylolyticus]
MVGSWVSHKLQNRRYDVDVAVLGLIAAMLLFPMRFFVSQILIELVPIVVGTGCLLYLLAARSERRTANALPALPATVVRVAPSVVMLGVGILAVMATLMGGRNVVFYDVAAILASLVLAQILFAHEEDLTPGIILTQIVALAAVIRLAAVFTTTTYFGVDVWTHMIQFVGGIHEAESLGAIAGDKHFAAPFFHLLVVGATHVLDLSPRMALFMTIGLVMPFSAVLVYMAARLLVPTRWALFAAGLYSISDHAIQWGIHVIPTSMGIVFFLAFLYVLLRVLHSDYKTRDFFLLILLSVAVILTHQVSSFIMLVLLGAGLAGKLLLSTGLFTVPSTRSTRGSNIPDSVNLSGLLVFNLGFITFMWSLTPYQGSNFLTTILDWFGDSIASSGLFQLQSTRETEDGEIEAVEETATMAGEFATYIDELGFLLLLLLALVGCLYLLQRQRASHSAFTMLTAISIMLVFVLGLPLFGIVNFIPGRWFAFLYALLAITGAIGVRFLAREGNPTLVVVVLVVFLLAFPSIMMLSGNGAIDNPPFPGEQERLGYTEQELDAADSIALMTGSPSAADLRNDQLIRTDQPYQTMIERGMSYPTEAATINQSEPVTHDLTLYRGHQSDGATYFSDRDHPVNMDIPEERICRADQSTLYDNGDVRLCQAMGPGDSPPS